MGNWCSGPIEPDEPDQETVFAHFQDFVKTHCELGHDRYVLHPVLVCAFAQHLETAGVKCAIHVATQWTDKLMDRAQIPCKVSPYWHSFEREEHSQNLRVISGIGVKSLLTKEAYDKLPSRPTFFNPSSRTRSWF